VDDETLGSDAALTGVLDAGGDRRLDRLVEVGAGKDEVGIASAQLEDDLLQIPPARLADAPPRALAARQRGGGDARVLEQLRDLLAADEERLEGAFGEARLPDEILHGERALRHVRRVLEE